MKGTIFSLNISSKKGIPKTRVDEAVFLEGLGIENDAHAQKGDREVSLLSIESIQKQKTCGKIKGSKISLSPGDFAENITTRDVKLKGLKIGDRLVINNEIILEISKIGKECHNYCAIYKKIGDCIMPREGMFARVIKGGKAKIGDAIEAVL